MPPPYPALDLGPLPVDLINRTMGTELEPGHARLSRQAHKHMAEDHASDYPVCITVLAQAIADPTFIGQDPKHGRNFVVVKRVANAGGQSVLVAIGLEPEADGTYSVRSCYLIPERTITERREARRLHIPRRI